MRAQGRCGLLALLAVATCSLQVASAILVQPHNYMLDDSAMLAPDQQDSGSLSPFFNDNQAGAGEQSADKDVVGILGDSLARIRYARMLEQQQQQDSPDEQAPASGQGAQLSQEMAELLQSEQAQPGDPNQEGSLSSSVAGLLLNVAQAAAQATANAPASSGADADQSSAGARELPNQQLAMSSRGNIMELDTSSSSGSQPSKADLKSTSHSRQWFNPKETIPVLKISSMATPSKYKKVYFRSEKKLVDGAFHSVPSSEEKDKKSALAKAFNSGKGVQRRSSRGTSSSAAPPGILQDGVIDFLKKFRDVYIQTRPVQQTSLASSVVSAAASSPLAALVAPSSASGAARPNLASAISAATSLMSSAAASPASAPAAGSSAAAGSGSAGSPFSAQSYVSFWSKTFPTWVRRMLKQMRRRSLYNSSKRQQHGQQSHHHATSLGQAAQAAASSVVEQATSSAGSSSSSGSP